MINPSREARVEGSHWVSPLNFSESLVSGWEFPTPLGLIDSTLRKTRYTAGAIIEIDGLLRIGQALADAGVTDECLNVGWFGEPTPNRSEFELAEAVLGAGFSFRTSVYTDTLLSNGASALAADPRAVVELVAGLGAELISPGVLPAPDREAEVRQLNELVGLVEAIRATGCGATVIFAQCGRRDFDQMMRAVNLAVEAGVERIDFMDSTSSLQTEAMGLFIRTVRSRLVSPVRLTMHPHDDFGLGTANAIAAAAAGAGPDVSVNGVSYRCGFAPLEEVVTALEVLYGVDTGIRLDCLTGLSQTVAREMGLPVPPLKPIVGEYAFLKHTPGDVLACLRQGERAFPPISGSLHAGVVGADVRWVWDTYSTPAMVRAYGEVHDLELSESEVAAVYAALDAAVRAIEQYPRWLEQDDVARIVDAALSSTRARSSSGI